MTSAGSGKIWILVADWSNHRSLMLVTSHVRSALFTLSSEQSVNQNEQNSHILRKVSYNLLMFWTKRDDIMSFLWSEKFWLKSVIPVQKLTLWHWCCTLIKKNLSLSSDGLHMIIRQFGILNLCSLGDWEPFHSFLLHALFYCQFESCYLSSFAI